jgi:hypothetical protein
MRSSLISTPNASGAQTEWLQNMSWSEGEESWRRPRRSPVSPERRTVPHLLWSQSLLQRPLSEKRWMSLSLPKGSHLYLLTNTELQAFQHQSIYVVCGDRSAPATSRDIVCVKLTTCLLHLFHQLLTFFATFSPTSSGLRRACQTSFLSNDEYYLQVWCSDPCRIANIRL